MAYDDFEVVDLVLCHALGSISNAVDALRGLRPHILNQTMEYDETLEEASSTFESAQIARFNAVAARKLPHPDGA